MRQKNETCRKENNRQNNSHKNKNRNRTLCPDSFNNSTITKLKEWQYTNWQHGKWVLATVALTAVVSVSGCGTTNLSNQTADKNASTATNQVANRASDPSSDQSTAKVTYPLTVTDQANHKITIPKQPHHIASITLGTDEILSGLVPKQDIAMVTTWASDPAQSNILDFAKGIPAIKDANAEQIIAVHPDLALMASYTNPGVVDQLNQANIPTYEFSNFNSIQDIENNIEVVGKLVGQPEKAKQMVVQLEQQLKQVKKAVQGQKPVRVLNYSNYGFAAGSNTTMNDIIVDAGGINAAAQLNGWQKITDEQIVKLNPDVMIYSESAKGFKNQLLNKKALQSVNAIKNKRIYGIKDGDLSSLSQYVGKGVQEVAHVLYPKAKIGQ